MLKLLALGLCAGALWAQGRPATAEAIKRGLPAGKGTAVGPWRVAADGAVTHA